MTLPKLSSLTPEQRRVMCAEALGWTQEKALTSNLCWRHPSGALAGRVSDGTLSGPPNFDHDANAALQLVEHLAKEGILPHITTDGTDWRVFFSASPMGKRFPYAIEPTFQRAIVSAFLIATGKAQL